MSEILGSGFRIERNERSGSIVDFLDRINANQVLGSEETKRDFIENISFDGFREWIVRFNGILRSIPFKEHSLDGKDVALVPNPEQTDEFERVLLGESETEYPPRESDKEILLKELFELTKTMEEQGSDLKDIALLLAAGINAVHPFGDGNGRTSRLLYYLITTDYTGSKEQKNFLKKILGEHGRLFININPGDAKGAIIDYIRSYQLNIDDDDRNQPRYLSQANSTEVLGKVTTKVPQEILADFQRHILEQESDFGFFAVYFFLQKKGRLVDFLTPVKNMKGVLVRTDLSAVDLIEKLEIDEFSEILEEYWRIKKESVSLLLRGIAEPEKFKNDKSRDERFKGKTIKESFLASLDRSDLRSFKEVNMENVEEVWQEKDTLPFSTETIKSEEMLRLVEVNAKLKEFKDREKNERAAIGFDFEKADEEYELAKREVDVMRGREFPEEGTDEYIEHGRLLEIAQKKLYEIYQRIYRPIIEFENRYLTQVVQYLDGLGIWKTKFTTRNEKQFSCDEEKNDTDSIYYVTKTGQSLRIIKYGLVKDGLSGIIEPFMEKIFFIDNQYENFRDRAKVSEQAAEGLFVMEYTTDEFLESQDSSDTQDFISRIRRYEKGGKIIYLNPVDGHRHRGYSINRFL